VHIWKWTIYMSGGALLKRWTSMETPQSGSFIKGKKTKNSLPNVLLMSWHSTTSNPLNFFLTIRFVKVFSFFSTSIFSFFLFFYWARATKPLKVYECVVGTPLRVFLRFIFLNLKELDKLIPANDHVVQCFILHGTNKKTFLNRRWGKFIIDSVYWANKAHQLLFPWVL